MTTQGQRLTIIGDIGVDLVLGPVSGWPQPGTETLMDRSEMRAGGSAGNAALAVSYLGGHSRLLSVVGSDDLGSWLRDQLRGLGASLDVCDAPTTLSVGLIHTWGERTFFTTRGQTAGQFAATPSHPDANGFVSPTAKQTRIPCTILHKPRHLNQRIKSEAEQTNLLNVFLIPRNHLHPKPLSNVTAFRVRSSSQEPTL